MKADGTFYLGLSSYIQLYNLKKFTLHFLALNFILEVCRLLQAYVPPSAIKTGAKQPVIQTIVLHSIIIGGRGSTMVKVIITI